MVYHQQMNTASIDGSLLQSKGEWTYDDEALSCVEISFRKTPPCTRGKYESKACAKEDKHEHDVYPRRTDNVHDVQTSACD
jgi:hypothetical protein